MLANPRGQGYYFAPQRRGAIAQLGERLHGMQEVSGSIPLGSTTFDIRPSKVLQLEVFRASPSSRGLGHHPFTVATGVRIPVGTPLITNNEDPADNRVFFVHRLPAFRLWRCGSPAFVAMVEPERKKFKKNFHKREHAGMIGGSVTRGHSSAGRAPAWHAGGQRFDPAWLHHFRH